MYHLGWFSTGRGKGSQGLLNAMYENIATGYIKAKLDFVFCSREPGEAEGSDQFIQMVHDFHIPLVCLSYQRYKRLHGKPDGEADSTFPGWRTAYDREIMVRLKPYSPSLCVLAGYMLVVGPEMCARYNMLNLHPATPQGPKGTWQQVIWELIDHRAQESGAMMHLVTPSLDRGPVVTYCTFPLRGARFGSLWNRDHQRHDESDALFQLIRQQGVQREIPLVITTVRAFSEGLIRIEEGKVVNRTGEILPGFNLTDEIEGILRKTLPG
jgi:phosphoribosylglycinamide formyltransferase 1